MDKNAVQEWLFRTALVFVIKQLNNHEDIFLGKVGNPGLREVIDEATDRLSAFLIKAIGTKLKTEPSKVSDLEIIKYNGMKDLMKRLESFEEAEREYNLAKEGNKDIINKWNEKKEF